MDLEVHLGGENDVVAARVFPYGAAHDLLGAAETVDVGGIPEIDAKLQGLLEERLGILFTQGPFAEPS